MPVILKGQVSNEGFRKLSTSLQRSINVRKVATIKPISEVMEGLEALEAYYALKENHKEVGFYVGDFKFSSLWGGKKVVLNSRCTEFHETLYKCNLCEIDFDFNTGNDPLLLFESWLTDIKNEIYMSTYRENGVMGRQYLPGEKEFDEFFDQILVELGMKNADELKID
jgi:hypothetical protein